MGAALELSPAQLTEFLGQKAERLARVDLRPAWQAVKVLLVAETRRNFAEGHGPDGQAWLPLKSPGSKRGGAKSKPLRSSGILMASVSAGGQGHVEQEMPTSLVWGSMVSYAGVHQWGHTFSRPERTRDKPWVFFVGGKKVFTRKIRAHSVSVPARPFLGLSERILDRTVKILGEHLERGA